MGELSRQYNIPGDLDILVKIRPSFNCIRSNEDELTADRAARRRDLQFVSDMNEAGLQCVKYTHQHVGAYSSVDIVHEDVKLV